MRKNDPRIVDQPEAQARNKEILDWVKKLTGTNRGEILCQRCARSRSGRVCKYCMHDACFVRLRFEKKRLSFFYTRSGQPHSWTSAHADLVLMNAEIREGIFDPAKWSRTEIERRHFKNLYGDWLDQKKKEVERGTFSFATLRLYDSYFQHHYELLYEKDVRAIRLKDLQDMLDKWPSTLSLKYRLNMMLAVRTFLKWALKWGTIDKLPAFPEIRTDGGNPSRAITYEEQIIAIDKPELQPHRDIFLYMREMALRISEVCAVKVKDIDLENRRMLVQRTFSERQILERTKSRKKDWLPLTPEAFEIAERLMQNRFGEEILFLNPRTAQGYLPDFLRRIWRKHSGTDVTCYEAMRHSTISDWSRQGANAYTIRDGARHSDIRTSSRYVHHALNDVRDMMSRKNVVKMKPLSESGKRGSGPSKTD